MAESISHYLFTSPSQLALQENQSLFQYCQVSVFNLVELIYKHEAVYIYPTYENHAFTLTLKECIH